MLICRLVSVSSTELSTNVFKDTNVLLLNRMNPCCVIFNISTKELKNYVNDDFFFPNAVNSFTKWNPNVKLLVITNENLKTYVEEGYTWTSIGILRVHVINYLLSHNLYSKVIMLGADTITCGKLDEFLDCNDCDLICSLGPYHWEYKTVFWAAPKIQYEYNERRYEDNTFINADVTCFNTAKAAKLVHDISIEQFSSGHHEQGGLNYCFLNQGQLDLKVKIVDFPYALSNVIYNVRSKGIAAGGGQMRRGKLYYGFDGPEISTVYPTAEYSVKDDKLFTSDGKQIKVFHYAENICFKSDSDGSLPKDEQIREMKTMWFNKETVLFLNNHCNCSGFT